MLNKVHLDYNKNSLSWLGNNEQFSTKDLYSKLNVENQLLGFWSKLWKLKVPARIKNFIWKLLNEILTVRVFLKRRMFGLDTMCPLGHQEEETVLHLFWNYSLTCKVWLGIKSWWNLNLNADPYPVNLVTILHLKEINHAHREVWMIVVVLTRGVHSVRLIENQTE